MLFAGSCKGTPPATSPDPEQPAVVDNSASAPLEESLTTVALPPCSVTTYQEPSGARISLTAYSYDTEGRVSSQTTYLRRREPPGPSPPDLPGIVPERQTTRFSYPNPNTTVEEFDGGDDGSVQRRTVTNRNDQIEQVETDYDADGVVDEVVRRLFDSHDRIQNEVHSVGGQVVSEQTWEWDDRGNLVEHRTIREDLEERVVKLYDERGRQVRETHYRDDEGLRLTHTTEYDLDRPVRITTRNASDEITEVIDVNNLGEHVIVRTRADANGDILDEQREVRNQTGQVVRRETRVGDRVTRVEMLEYDEFGDLSAIQYEHTTSYRVRHDNSREDGRLIETRYVRESPDATDEYLFSHRFEYNPLGRLAVKTDVREGQVRRRWRYTYNELGRMSSEGCDGCTPQSPLADGVYDQTTRYSYDGEDRMIRAQVGGGPSVVVSNILTEYEGGLTTTTVVTAEEGPQTGTTRVERTDDERGNLLHVVRFGRDDQPLQSIDYSYDSDARLVEEVRRDSSGAAEFRATWVYRDGLLQEHLQDGPGELPADGQIDLRTVNRYDCWND